ncbi:MAG: glycosyltransferase [Candidatus Tectomicrobia bacterium]|nr:glycosyltransferase [Candidatus Tectomicrobia bacterium]
MISRTPLEALPQPCGEPSCGGEVPRLRILFVHETLRIGGAEKVRAMALRHLPRQRYEVEVCCIEEVGAIGEELRRLGVPVTCLNTRGKSYNLRAAWRLYRFLKAKRFDVVQSSLFLANLHARLAAILAGVPHRIIEEHSVADRFGKRLTFLYRWLDEWLARRTDIIICCAEAVRAHVAGMERIDARKFRVLHNGLDATDIEAPLRASEQAGLREELGLIGAGPVIGSIGSFAPWKGKDDLVPALGEVVRLFPEARLVLVGNAATEHGRRLRAQFEAAGLAKHVLFPGERRDVGRLLHLFDLYVSPSHYDALPMAVLEAMAAGLPVVATLVGGVPEIVAPGETGLLVGVGESRALAAAMLELLEDPARARRWGEAGRRRVRDLFSVSRYIAGLEAIYDALPVVRG